MGCGGMVVGGGGWKKGPEDRGVALGVYIRSVEQEQDKVCDLRNFVADVNVALLLSVRAVRRRPSLKRPQTVAPR